MIRKIANMFINKDKVSVNDANLIILCGVAINDVEIVEIGLKLGGNGGEPCKTQHIKLLQQYGYFKELDDK